MMERVTGEAECPKCGDEGPTVLRRGTWGGKPTARFRCDECEHEWTAMIATDESEPIEPISYSRSTAPPCKTCGDGRMTVRSTRRIGNTVVRFHKCDNPDCGATGKSVDGQSL